MSRCFLSYQQYANASENIFFLPTSTKQANYTQKKRGTDIPDLLTEVVRITLRERCRYNNPRYSANHYTLLSLVETSHISVNKTSINASLINMYGLVHRQTNGKNMKREWNSKIYFCTILIAFSPY